jgi:uncharacterized phage protein (TIGR02218 family)
MKTLTTNIVAEAVTTLALCYRLTRTDGVVLTFTSLDKDLLLGGVTYRATTSLSSTAIESTADLRVDNLDVEGILSDDSITAEDLLRGVYDNTLVEVFLVDYVSPPTTITPQTVLWLRSAYIAEIRITEGKFVAELRGLASKLATVPMEVYTPTCRVKKLGDARCNVNTAAYSFSYTVVAKLSERSFTHNSTVQADGYFQFGTLKWTTGANFGREASIKTYASGVIELLEPLPFALAVGDAFTAIRGCNRQFATCRDVFNNVANFRGEPPHLLPGIDKLISPMG